MKPFRKNVAIAIDGGGIRGIIITRALTFLEQHLGQSVNQIFRLAAGTSTGSIISTGIACGLSAAQMNQLYLDLGSTIFKKSWRSAFFPLTRYRYPHEPLASALRQYFGDHRMGDFWSTDPPTDLVVPCFDLVDNRSRYIKPWKEEYQDWSAVTAVLASSSVPTYFPVVEGRFVDGGVGAYANPCYLAAYELRFCLGWDPAETTLISLGTGREPHHMQTGEADRYFAWNWLGPVLGAFLQSSDDQQVHLVGTLFEGLDFRRFQVNLRQSIAMDDAGKLSQLEGYGEELANLMLNDLTDPIPQIKAARPA